MKRNDWKFQLPAKDLLDAADGKAKVHQAKKEWWEKKKAETIAKVKESGIEVHDSIASYVSNTKGDYGAQIVIDPTLQRDLNECHGKIQIHDATAKSYVAWVKILGLAKPTDTYELDQQDYEYFFGE